MTGWAGSGRRVPTSGSYASKALLYRCAASPAATSPGRLAAMNDQGLLGAVNVLVRVHMVGAEELNSVLFRASKPPGTAVRLVVFRRSRSTVGTEVKCSHRVQLRALPTRSERHRHCADHRCLPHPIQSSSPASTCTYALHHATSAPKEQPPSALPYQPDPAHLSFPSSHCPLLVPSKSNTRQQCTDGACVGRGAWSGARRLQLVRHPPPSRSHPLPSSIPSASTAARVSSVHHFAAGSVDAQ
jgi:hypothetical protein